MKNFPKKLILKQIADALEPSKYNAKFAGLTDREKEGWYDEIYQEGLMAYLSLEQVDREKKIRDFKTK